MTDCIFCRLIRKEVPAKVLYEDEAVLAFLDVNPVAPGHTLVVPKQHFESIFDLPDELAKKMISISKKLCEKLRQEHNADGINILNASGKAAQQSVSHFHMHLVPRHTNDKLDLWFHGKGPEEK